MASRAQLDLEVQMRGADKAAKELKDIGNEAEGLGSKMGKVFGAMGTAAVAGVAVAGAAVAGFAAKGIADFVQFETQMNEVFTLMPGISERGMGRMTENVKDFAKEFGVLPEKVVPALYQSLSAGVPPDNVFEFLEVAQKAAKGGVTDLTTAVDGITSVVNAYGEELVDATKASDLMFTTVKLGKTNFSEMSKSLFNVIPTAASLGVKFEDVTAALATLTLQGTPTSVATTQIRAAFVEASKGGTKLSDAITELTGKSFTELIASGKDIGTIFNELRGSMDEQKFKDLFGSVEGLNAVLGITGPNADSFAKTLEQMGGAAGATDTAFKTMDKGLGSALEKLQAAGAVLLLEIGEKLAPMLSEFASNLIEWFNNPEVQAGISNLIDAIGTGLTTAFQTISIVGQWLATNVIGPLWSFFSQPEVQTNLQNIASAIGGALVGAFEALKTGAGWVWDNILKPVFEYVQKPEVKSAIEGIANAIGSVLGGAWTALKTAAEFVWNNILKPFFEWLGQPDVQNTIGSIANAIGTGLAGAFTLLEGAAKFVWENILVPFWDFVKGAAAGIGEVAGAISGGLVEAWNGLTAAAQGAWDIIQAVWNFLTGQAATDAQTAGESAVGSFGTGLSTGMTKVANEAKIAAALAGEAITAGVKEGIERTKDVPFIGMSLALAQLEADTASKLESKSPSQVYARFGETIPQGLGKGITDKQADATTPLTNMLGSILSTTQTALTVANYQPFGETVASAIGGGITALTRTATDAATSLQSGVKGEIEPALTVANYSPFGDNVVKGIWEGMNLGKAVAIDAARAIGEGVQNKIKEFITYEYFKGAGGAVSGGIRDGIGTNAEAAKGRAYDLGWAISQGVANGIAANASTAINAAINMAKAALRAAKDALGIASPSKVMQEYGKMAALGFAQGVGMATPMVAQATGRMIGGAATSNISIGGITIHAPGANAAQIANQIVDELSIRLQSQQRLNLNQQRVYG